MKVNFTRFIPSHLALISLFLLINTVQINAQRRATTEMDRVRIEMNREKQKLLADRKEKMKERMKERKSLPLGRFAFRVERLL